MGNIPVVNLSCHRGSVLSIANDPSGRYLVTTGIDRCVKIWDLRVLQPLHQYINHRAIFCTDVSQKGLVALGDDQRVQIYKENSIKKQNPPYMNQTLMKGSQ